MFLGELLGAFSVKNRGLTIYKVESEISIKNEKVFFAEKRVLRERFKVALKEIGKEKLKKNFFIDFDFFI